MLFNSLLIRNNVSYNDLKESIKNSFEKDYNDLSDKTKETFKERYELITNIILNEKIR